MNCIATISERARNMPLRTSMHSHTDEFYMKRSETLKALRHKAFIEQGRKCIYCEAVMWHDVVEQSYFRQVRHLVKRQSKFLRATAEHLIPQYIGGDIENNIAAACSFCNSKRNQAPTDPLAPEEYKEYVQDQMQRGNWHHFSIQLLLPGI